MTLARLQLAVGAAATLIDELPGDGPRRLFSARAPHESSASRASRLVVLHPAPPAGPHPGALLDRMASIRALGHPALVAPLATGVFDQQAWVVEPAPAVATLADRLAAGSLLTVHDTVQLLRDSARALAALHRRGLHHGALVAGSFTLDSNGAQLHRLGREIAGSVTDDLHMLGLVAERCLRGDSSSTIDALPRRSRAVPDQLERLLASLTDADPMQRPASADAVLSALDWFPAPGPRSHRTLLEGVSRGGRSPGHRQAAMLLGVTAVLLLLAWLLLRPR